MSTPPHERRTSRLRGRRRRLGATCLVLAATFSAAGVVAAPVVVEREVFLMGTRCRLATWTAARTAALHRLERFVRSLEESDAELTTWRDDSPLGRINRQSPGTTTRLSPSVCRSLALAGRWRDETAAAFEPAIGPLMEAWDVRGRGRVPPAADAEAARRRSSFARLRFDRAACTVTPEAGTRLDTGAFGKGEAVDRLRALPEAASGDGWLVDLGGQVAVGGTPPEPGGWLVAVARAGARDRPAFEIRLTRGSLATSAGSERDLVVAGQRIGHILDARTGKPAAFAGSVTVWHDLGLAADALSTALYVMGPQTGIPWGDARGVAACFQVPVGRSADRHTLVPTRAFSSRFPGACQPTAP